VVLQPVASSFGLLKAAQFQSKLVSQVELVAVSESSASQPRGSGLSVKFDQNSQPEIRLQLELRPVRFMSDVGNTVPVTHCRGSLNRVLSKTGFHRNLLTNLNIAESDQCVIAPSAPFCWLWSLENVPDSMYIDPFEIQVRINFLYLLFRVSVIEYSVVVHRNLSDLAVRKVLCTETSTLRNRGRWPRRTPRQRCTAART
jgi:hypothetical protein